MSAGHGGQWSWAAEPVARCPLPERGQVLVLEAHGAHVAVVEAPVAGVPWRVYGLALCRKIGDSASECSLREIGRRVRRDAGWRDRRAPVRTGALKWLFSLLDVKPKSGITLTMGAMFVVEMLPLLLTTKVC